MDQTELYRQMSNSKQPQKCLLHNNPLTLFCKHDNRPLCVTCAYQTNHHRQHTVVPLLKAVGRIEANLKSYSERCERAVAHIEDIISITSANIEKAD